MSAAPTVEDLLRDLAPRVLGALVRRHGQFEACEDAVQEALIEAAAGWAGGVPDNPYGWLLTVAGRRLTDQWRSESARRARELSYDPAPAEVSDQDDTLTLFFLCCHPALSPSSQVALTLRAVGGLTTAQIAAAFLVPEATVGQRVSRAKARIRGAGFPRPDPRRLPAVLHVLYLIFNEGYTASSGPDLQRAELTREALRLTRQLHRLLPDDGEVTGLLALMLFTDARRRARSRPDGTLVPLAEQDRRLWDAERIAEATALITGALTDKPLGPYQVQAAIAGVHARPEPDWAEIEALYRLLEHLAPGPMVTLNHAVALSMVDGPAAGLALLSTLDGDERVNGHHRYFAVRAHLRERAGDRAGARADYREAARRTTSVPERRYLSGRAGDEALPA